MNRIQLKVKIISLADEAKTIRREEKKALTPELRHSLTEHRKGIVRHEARHSLLLYGFMNGKQYREIEAYTERPPSWSKIKRMAKRFIFEPELRAALVDWCGEGQLWLDGKAQPSSVPPKTDSHQQAMSHLELLT